MKKQIILYIIIIIICVVALIMGVYYQFFKKNTNSETNNTTSTNTTEETEQTQEALKTEFNNLFTNKLDKKGYNTSNIEKNDASKEIIYPLTSVKNDASYEMDLNIPVFNIAGEIPTSFNDTTQKTFLNKANQIITGTSNQASQTNETNETNDITINTTTNTRVLYDVVYQAYINGNILSVVIKSTLKEGDNAQRVMVQTYNYNLATGEKIELKDLIEPYGLNENDITSKIEDVTTEANEQATVLENSGYETYKRDLTSENYEIENIKNFFLGANGELYIIFAYGNNDYTSEMDIIKMNTYPQINNYNTNSTLENNTTSEESEE